MSDFSLSAYFNSFDLDKLPDDPIDNAASRIDSLTNGLANNPDSVVYNADFFEDLLDLCHGFKGLDSSLRKQFTYLVASSYKASCANIHAALTEGSFADSIDQIKSLMQRYAYAIFVLMSILGKEDFSGLANVSKAKKASSKILDEWRINCAQVLDLLDAVESCLKLNLSLVFITTPERSAFVELFNRPLFHLMEAPDRMKTPAIKTLMFRSVALMVTQHGHASTIQNSIIQSLTYFMHLPQYMAELLYLLDAEYDYSGLSEEVLREVSQIEFNSNDNNGPKSISEFLVNLSQLSPRLILKQMAPIAQLLDNSNQTLRCSVVESCGNIVVNIIKADTTFSSDETDGRNDNDSNQVENLMDLLQERLLDQNPYVRTKALQALTKICSLEVKLSRRRQAIMVLAVRSLDDKSTLVRRNAIKLMSKLLINHPFAAIHGTQLSLKKWRERLDASNEVLASYIDLTPDLEKTHKKHQAEKYSMEQDKNEDDRNEDIEMEEENIDADESRSEAEIDQEEFNESMIEHEKNLPDTNVLVKARLTAKYYEDAVAFIEAIHIGTETISNLLFSRNRNEVLESMDFLVVADAYGIENAQHGIRKMLHLVWMKGSSDEGKSISSHLIDCYRDLFLTAPSDLSAPQRAALIAKNLIGITLTSSLADLASFERLLCMMYNEKLIAQDIITVLWQIYGHSTDDLSEDQLQSSRDQRVGSIIVLGMLALADHKIVLKGLDSLLKIGLDLKNYPYLELCKYTCIALQRIVPVVSKSKDLGSYKVEREDEIIERLSNTLLTYNDNPEWYSVAEQATSAIFRIATAPDEVCSRILIQRAKVLFAEQTDASEQVYSLSQLLFLVGHVAVKAIVYLERLETLFKKKKHDSEAKKENANDEEDNENELEMIGGTTEDDFTDAVIYIKERELLYGEHSLLARFGPIAREICMNSKTYGNTTLQRSAALCMVKLMCVSSKYCEENLPLLITIMERSPDPIIRSNCVLGLGDMAVCFNNLVDENTDFLYRRLTDENIMVQRTCLMTVTFLILAGQVKVKGQLSSMAKCLENKDQGISDMCRLFFTELATKDNAIYNGFIDIFNGLSNDDTLDKDAMKRIVKFLVSFIEKEKHQKQLSEKLLIRLNKVQNEQQWNDIAFVLQSIPFKNEKITKTLEDGYKMVEIEPE